MDALMDPLKWVKISTIQIGQTGSWQQVMANEDTIATTTVPSQAHNNES